MARGYVRFVIGKESFQMELAVAPRGREVSERSIAYFSRNCKRLLKICQKKPIKGEFDAKKEENTNCAAILCNSPRRRKKTLKFVQCDYHHHATACDVSRPLGGIERVRAMNSVKETGTKCK